MLLCWKKKKINKNKNKEFNLLLWSESRLCADCIDGPVARLLGDHCKLGKHVAIMFSYHWQEIIRAPTSMVVEKINWEAVCQTEPCLAHSKCEVNIWSYDYLPWKTSNISHFHFSFLPVFSYQILIYKTWTPFSPASTVPSDITLIIVSPGLYWRNWVNIHPWGFPFCPWSLNYFSATFWHLCLPDPCLTAEEPGIHFHIWWW